LFDLLPSSWKFILRLILKIRLYKEAIAIINISHLQDYVVVRQSLPYPCPFGAANSMAEARWSAQG
jgi:hypothetical protein